MCTCVILARSRDYFRCFYVFMHVYFEMLAIFILTVFRGAINLCSGTFHIVMNLGACTFQTVMNLFSCTFGVILNLGSCTFQIVMNLGSCTFQTYEFRFMHVPKRFYFLYPLQHIVTNLMTGKMNAFLNTRGLLVLNSILVVVFGHCEQIF